MAAFLVVIATELGKFEHFALSDYSFRQWGLIVMAGIAGAVPWLFYFLALRDGNASAAAVIDQLSLVFMVILAALFLSEKLTFQVVMGAGLMAFGAILISLKPADLVSFWSKLF